MSDSSGSDPFGFAKFIPGFDFLQSLSQSAAGAAGAAPSAPLAGMAQWIAPTASVEDIDKRIQELRSVQFWLEQNGRALTATIQALEVQKMTLATLQSMQGGLSEWAKASPFKMPETGAPAPAAAAAAPKAAPAPSAPPAQDTAEPPQASAAAAIDPMQWWGALTQQFQQIATQALQEPAGQKAMEAGTQMASELARTAMQTATDLAQVVQPAAAPVKPAPAKPAARKAAPAAKKTAAPAAKKPAAKKAAATKTPRR
ncbi:hypothetical protein N0K08_18210 [Acidovorax sp. Be4]|uniref:Transcriptional regulator n=1 Tax=Acidovorax bellezanensis TaxID=2976702 RepID=A0ABT2PS09_9BURK|nr:PhaM family polyhydroxyalkanoate granule multifunctional regulatory protein [Acidovorax sp. Be4]MCT9812569.1 hypothetical protein [Acidovorax sp. Be4]